MSNTELKKVRGRVQNKHKTATEWYADVYDPATGLIWSDVDPNKTPFIPLAGELIIYDPDSDCNYYRFKIGNDKDNVVDLPFARDMELVQGYDNLSNLIPLYVPYGNTEMGAEVFEALSVKRPIYVSASIPYGDGTSFSVDIPLVATQEEEGAYALIFSTMGHMGRIGTSEEQPGMGLGLTAFCGPNTLGWFQISTFEIPTLTMMEGAIEKGVETAVEEATTAIETILRQGALTNIYDKKIPSTDKVLISNTNGNVAASDLSFTSLKDIVDFQVCEIEPGRTQVSEVIACLVSGGNIFYMTGNEGQICFLNFLGKMQYGEMECLIFNATMHVPIISEESIDTIPALLTKVLYIDNSGVLQLPEEDDEILPNGEIVSPLLDIASAQEKFDELGAYKPVIGENEEVTGQAFWVYRAEQTESAELAELAKKVENSLVINFPDNAASSEEDTNTFTYNGSESKTIDITPEAIGAQPVGTYKVEQQIVTDQFNYPTSAGEQNNWAPKILTELTQNANGEISYSTKELTPGDLGLSNALHFIGFKTSLPSTANDGDVVIVNDVEHVWANNKWNELGDADSHALKSIKITANEGLTGGGTLAGHVTIGIANGGVTTPKLADGAVTREKLEDEIIVRLDKELERGNDTSGTETLQFGDSFSALTSTAVDDHIIKHGITTYTLPDDRLFSMLIPDGTSIQANKDLKTVEYLKAGRYYCTQNETVKTLKNCPTTKAFILEVLSPISKTVDNETTGTWVYRLRKLTTIDGTQYTQFIHSDGTVGNFVYDSWKIIPRAPFTTKQDATAGGSAALGDEDTPIYIDANGNFVQGDKKADFASYQHDDTDVAIRLSNSNEINFKATTDYIHFGYANRLNDPTPIHTYKFGTHSGEAGSVNGTIECGKVKMGEVSMQYDTEKQALKFVF